MMYDLAKCEIDVVYNLERNCISVVIYDEHNIRISAYDKPVSSMAELSYIETSINAHKHHINAAIDEIEKTKDPLRVKCLRNGIYRSLDCIEELTKRYNKYKKSFEDENIKE